MTLETFIKFFICRNSIVRLWTEYNGGHKMICDENGQSDIMEWQILKGDTFFSKYLDWMVIGVTNIVCDHNPEAINIVISGYVE